VKCIAVISCFFFGQLSVSFLGPCCPAPLYCIAVHDCLMLAERINDDDDDDVCQQVLALALFISACQLDSRFGWVDFVSFTGLLQAAAFFTVHILNRFPDVLNAFVIVSLMPWFHAQFIAFFACNYCNLSVVMENIHGCSVFAS